MSEYTDAVARLVAEAPPLAPEQLARLTVLLHAPASRPIERTVAA